MTGAAIDDENNDRLLTPNAVHHAGSISPGFCCPMASVRKVKIAGVTIYGQRDEQDHEHDDDRTRARSGSTGFTDAHRSARGV